ncbi:MAG: zeta toxin family protein [Clostridia bacterium]|nr:zeta toxin family protein [Clostridia bacterium]
MSELNKKIRELIEKETNAGHFSVLDETSCELIEQIFDNYQKMGKIQKVDGQSSEKLKAELIFVAAPTGAGKDSLVARLEHQNPEKKYVELNMDIFRYYFPKFIEKPEELTDKNFALMTNEFSYEIFATIQEILLQEFPGTNVIITGTLRETDWVEKTFERFKQDEKTDYKVKLACLAVPKKESAISVIQRYIGIINTQKTRLDAYPGTARFTSMQYHDETFEKFPTSLEYFQKKLEDEPGKLIDGIEVYRRGRTAYDLEEDTKVYSSYDMEDTRTALDVVIGLRLKPYQMSNSDILLLIHRIKENYEYLRAQGTLRETIRDLAIISEHFETVKRLDKIHSENDTLDTK